MDKDKLQAINDSTLDGVSGGKDHISQEFYNQIQIGDRLKWEDGWGWDEAVVECVEAPSDGRYAKFRVVEMLNGHTTFSASYYENVKIGDFVFLTAFNLDRI